MLSKTRQNQTSIACFLSHMESKFKSKTGTIEDGVYLERGRALAKEGKWDK